MAIIAQGVASSAGGRRFNCTTLQEAGWSGKENRELLALADASFDVLVTIDRNLRYQQKLTGRRIAPLIVSARSNRGVDLGAALLHLRRDVANHSTGTVVDVGSSA